MRPAPVPIAVATAGVGAAVAGYALLVRGSLTVDIGAGRRVRQLGPLTAEVAAPREAVFDIIASPYLGRPTRAVAEKIRVLERGQDMVLAAHRTPVSFGLTATTVETVRFERPHTVWFRLVRGPVPHVVERFDLSEDDGRTQLTYTGELGTDCGWLGKWWGARVAAQWLGAVQGSLNNVRAEAERKAGGPERPLA